MQNLIFLISILVKVVLFEQTHKNFGVTKLFKLKDLRISVQCL